MVKLTDLSDLFFAPPGAGSIRAFDGDDSITGSGTADVIFGGQGDDLLKGLAGDDLLSGNAGDDVIRADAGNDTLYGGGGDDRLFGGDGDDDLRSGNDGSDDALFGGAGDDRLHSVGPGMAVGGAGNDWITGAVPLDGQLHIWARSGDDVLNLDLRNVSGSHGHHAFGGSGADTFNFTNLAAADHITIGRIDDFDATRDTLSVEGVVVHGDAGDHRRSLEDLPETLDIPGLGPVQLRVVEYQQAATGTFDLGAQQFLAIGLGTGEAIEWIALYALEGARRNGPDTEEIHYINMGFVTSEDVAAMPIVRFVDQENYVPAHLVDLAGLTRIETPDETITGTNGSDHIFVEVSADPTLRDNLIYGGRGHDVIEAGKAEDTVYGGNGNDLIAGGLDDDLLMGGAGHDRIFGGSENDLLYGGTGNDVLRGGGEDDVIHGQRGWDKLSGGSGNDTLYGGTWSDTLYGGAGEDRLVGGSSDDFLFAGADDDVLLGGGGHDSLRGWHGSDVLYGGSGNDQIDGGVFDDTLYGEVGNDVLYGGDGNDHLYGGRWADTLYGGSGSDKLSGGGGFDTFVFNDAFRSDRIVDFSTDNREKIDLSGVSALGDFDDVLAHLTASAAGHAVIDLGDGNRITLQGIRVEDFGESGLISADDFIF